MSTRVRVAVLAGIVVLVLATAGVYVLRVQREQRSAGKAAPAVPVSGLSTALAGPHLVFRNTALGNGYGQLAVVPLSDPGGTRALTGVSCERAYAVPSRTVCLSSRRGITNTYRAQVLDKGWKPTGDLPMTGLPSRVRLSRDGSLAVTTTFVYGDSYAAVGQFSTRTVITRVGGSGSADLETFTLYLQGERVTAADRNFWGVTFADEDTFYATTASGGRTWLVKGSLSRQRLDSVRTDVECPSLSPDHTRIAFKKHGGLPAGEWRLAVYDLRTRKETVLAETHSVDDQAEWLDDRTVLYGLPRTSHNGAATSDVWAVAADGSGTPRVLVQDAWSPAVIRR